MQSIKYIKWNRKNKKENVSLVLKGLWQIYGPIYEDWNCKVKYNREIRQQQKNPIARDEISRKRRRRRRVR